MQGPPSDAWKAATLSYDVDELKRYHKKKKIIVQRHPTHEICIWNYSNKVQWKGTMWDNITMNCRSLVTNFYGEVVARGFRKFFNLEDNLHTPTPEFEVFEKIDGCLGLLFYYESEWIFASRGSFVSDMAKKGSSLIMNRHRDAMENLPKHKSYVFELVYPEARIICDYGDKESVTYLTSFLKDGTEEPEFELMEKNGFEVVKKMDYHGSLEQLVRGDWLGREGFVVRFSNGDRVKVKFNQYNKLQKQMTKEAQSELLKLPRLEIPVELTLAGFRLKKQLEGKGEETASEDEDVEKQVELEMVKFKRQEVIKQRKVEAKQIKKDERKMKKERKKKARAVSD